MYFSKIGIARCWNAMYLDQWIPTWELRPTGHLKAPVFLYAFEESVDCHLLSSFCDDSNLHISLLKYVLSTMGVSKSQYVSRF